MYYKDPENDLIKDLFFTLTEAVYQFTSATFTARHLNIKLFHED